MSTFQHSTSAQTDLCVVATDFCAAVAVVVIVLFFIHPTCNGTCHIKRWWWVAGPYVFSHRGEGRVHAADFFQVSVVFKQAVSCPRSCSNGQSLIPCLNKQKTQAWSSPLCLHQVFKGFVHPKEKLSSFSLGYLSSFWKVCVLVTVRALFYFLHNVPLFSPEYKSYYRLWDCIINNGRRHLGLWTSVWGLYSPHHVAFFGLFVFCFCFCFLGGVGVTRPKA